MLISAHQKIDDGAAVNWPESQDKRGLLFKAVQYYCEGVTRLLLAHGASIDVRDYHGFTPLLVVFTTYHIRQMRKVYDSPAGFERAMKNTIRTSVDFGANVNKWASDGTGFMETVVRCCYKLGVSLIHKIVGVGSIGYAEADERNVIIKALENVGLHWLERVRESISHKWKSERLQERYHEEGNERPLEQKESRKHTRFACWAGAIKRFQSGKAKDAMKENKSPVSDSSRDQKDRCFTDCPSPSASSENGFRIGSLWPSPSDLRNDPTPLITSTAAALNRSSSATGATEAIQIVKAFGV
ncbi:MAG: hypothetical protein M1827_003087 [Pycnora praestabilis]|nr:MAG: hypothetical protein M1827_003087 [Pycnora praestabilis]